ncbi:MAG: TonB-dependent receptor [Candidatus Omnitrophica bacterium]|nr:TonB-dependent receptor [Candidatus Omnitrophota bacterium]
MNKHYLYQCVIALFVVFVSSHTGFALLTSQLDTVVVTATRIEQDSYKLAGNVSVITKEDIEASGARSVADVLKEVEGVFVYDNGSAKTTTVDIRGFGDTSRRNVLLLVNNRRVNAVSISGADYTQVPIGSIERIEIIRGGGSVLYGDNAVGGVVNIITKKGEGEFGGRLGGFYDSFSSQGGDVEVSGEWEGFDYYLYSRYLDKRGFRDNSDELYRNFSSRLGYEVNEQLGVQLEVGKHDDRYHLPGGLDESELATLGRSGSADNANVASTDDEYYKLSFDATPFADGEFGYVVTDLHYRNRHTYDSFSGFDTDRDIITRGINTRYIFDRTIFDHEVNFVTGIDYYTHENNIRGSKFNTDDLTISKDEFGVYGYLQYEILDNVFVNGGTRYHQAEYTFDDRGNSTKTELEPDEWVSMGGLKWEYANGSNIHFNAQQTFRFLSTDEWYSTFSGLNTNLKQQTGVQYEVGIKHNFADVLVASVTPYWMQTDDEIFYDPNSGFFGSNSNYDKIRRIGVESTMRLDVLDLVNVESELFSHLEFFTNYTYQRPEFYEGANDGMDVPMVPRHQTSHGIIATFMEYYNISLIGNYVGSRFIINDTLNQMPKAKPYYTLDSKVSFKNEFLEIYVGVNNIFDEEYAPYQIKKTATTRDVYPAPDTNYTYGVNYLF